MDQQQILKSIGSTEETTFNELCRELGDEVPTNGAEWRALFLFLDDLEEQGLVEISRAGGRIDSMILTEAGAAQVRGSR